VTLGVMAISPPRFRITPAETGGHTPGVTRGVTRGVTPGAGGEGRYDVGHG
jgi:hypothetical protein